MTARDKEAVAGENEELRLELMEERSITTENNDELLFSVTFNMCEH